MHFIYCAIPPKVNSSFTSWNPYPLTNSVLYPSKRKNISLNVQQFLKFLKSRRNKTERIKKKKQWKERSLEILKHTHTILKSNQKQRDFTLVKFPKSNASLWYSHKMAPHSSTLAWKNPMDGGACRLQSMGLQRVGHNWATSLSFRNYRVQWMLKRCHELPRIPSGNTSI